MHAFALEPLRADFPYARSLIVVRNHWRRDALLGEDGSRSRNANLLANVALLRSALLTLLAEHHPDQPLPELLEHFPARPARCLHLLNS